MFSAFQYFEAKELSLAGLCYILTMALLCALYFIADSPEWQFNSKTAHLVEKNYSIRYELTNDLQAKDIYHNLSKVFSNFEMSSVGHKVECDGKNCILTFTYSNTKSRRVAQAAHRQMQSL